MTVVIAYRTECDENGRWPVLRRILPPHGTGREDLVGPIAGRKPRPHISRREADDTIARHQTIDRTAATRLGVEIEHR